jgi:tetratricopeptide (TPR) repeat protein
MVAPLALPGLEDAARKVCACLEGDARRVTLYGRASSGKSSTMGLIAQQLGSQDWRVHRTQMTHDDDAGPIALATLAAGVSPDVRQRALDIAVPWKKKVDALVEALALDCRRVAILVDDPWLGSPDDAPSMFAERSADLLDRLERVPRLALVLSMSDRPLRGTVVDLPVAADPRAVLSAERWQDSPFHDAATQIRDSGYPRLDRMSPVELRLAVALTAKGMSAGDALLHAASGPRGLVRIVIESIGNARLRHAIIRLSIMRTPFDEATFDELLGTVSASERALVLDTLLFRTREGLVVPELVVHEARERLQTLSAAALTAAHTTAAAFHERQFGAATKTQDVTGATRHEMEIIHHLTEAGDAAAVLGRSVGFVEQYDKLGKTLSIRGVRSHQRKCLSLAVQAYARALIHDSEDAYAHHYRAYNLDILAVEADSVEQDYRRALELRPDHVWHHGRFISFLLTCGRAHEAHDAWDEALRVLDGVRRHSWLFRELHRPVARLLLHRGRLDFAREVLADVPEAMGGTWLAPTTTLLVQLSEAESDQLVFPASVAPDQRWGGPHLLISEDERARLVRWMPGRIERANGEIVIRFAESSSKFLRRTLSPAKFRAACPGATPMVPPAGTFLELLRFKGQAGDSIRCYPMSESPSGLPPLFPPPDPRLTPHPRLRTRNRRVGCGACAT